MKNKVLLISIILISFVIGITLIMGIVLLGNINNQNTQGNTNQELEALVNPISIDNIDQEDETNLGINFSTPDIEKLENNYSVYKNSDLDISIKYPSEWEILESYQSEIPSLRIKITKDNYTFDYYLPPGIGIPVCYFGDEEPDDNVPYTSFFPEDYIEFEDEQGNLYRRAISSSSDKKIIYSICFRRKGSPDFVNYINGIVVYEVSDKNPDEEVLNVMDEIAMSLGEEV